MTKSQFGLNTKDISYTEKLLTEWKHLKSKWNLKKWQIKLSRSRKQLGYCNCSTKTIYISTEFMRLNPFYIIRETLLHETAHAIQYQKSGITNHGKEWKKIAKQLGCSTKRCISIENLKMPKGKYIGKCPVCGMETHFYRKIRRRYSCGKCSKSYNDKFRLELLET